MELRPEDIENKEFLVALRGYDKDEVREFLHAVAAELRRVSQDESASRAELQAQWDELRAYISSVMRSAAEEASTIRLEAQRDAELMRREAREAPGGIRRRWF